MSMEKETGNIDESNENLLSKIDELDDLEDAEIEDVNAPKEENVQKEKMSKSGENEEKTSKNEEILEEQEKPKNEENSKQENSKQEKSRQEELKQKKADSKKEKQNDNSKGKPNKKDLEQKEKNKKEAVKDKQNKKEEAKEYKKENIKESKGKKSKEKSGKEIVEVKKPEKPTLLEEAEEGKKKKFLILVIIALIIFIVFIFSVIFALLNVSKTVIIKGVSVKNIDVSGLDISEAKNKITEAFNIELNTPIKIKTKDYETTLNTSQIEFEYNVAKAVEDAYSIGRNGNIFQNNYKILGSVFLGNEVELEYSYNSDSLDYIVNDIESKVPGLVTEASFYREGNELIIIPGTDGITVNKEKLKEEILNTIVAENAEEILNNNAKVEIEIPVENAKAKEIDIDSIYNQIYTEPKDAYYEAEPFKIYAEVEGVDFAISKDEAKEMVKVKQGEYRIPLTITPASKTIQDIGLEAFPYLISEFSTKYDASNRNRSQNLAIAAEKINGTVLMPGEEFSFNQVVGKRTIEEGYKDAKIYQNGQVVDGLAGGICQISSTLYNAVVKANLEVTERRNHSFTTSYVRAGQDATVVYGVIDFKFKNTRTYPIKISASVNSGIAEFKINGIKEEVEYSVSLYPVTTATIPYNTQYIQDPTLMPGQQAVVQAGSNGLKVTTYKDTKLDGKLISREVVSNDTYSPMNAIIRVGP